MLVRGLIEADEEFVEAIEPPGVDPERFKAAMRSFATGVVIVTVEVDGRIWGLTINSFCSISTSPPQVLISLAHGASCREPLLRTRRFGLAILSAQHRELAELGAVPGGPKHVDVFCERPGEHEGPVTVAGALAHLDCSVAETFEVSDHTLVIAQVAEAVVRGEDERPVGPLLYYSRVFHRLGDPLD